MENSIMLLRQGLSYANEEKYEESVKVIEEALLRGISDDVKKTALMQISVCLTRLAEYQKAEEYLLKYLEISKDLEGLELLATVYDLMEDPEKAFCIYTEIQKLDPSNVPAMLKIITLKKERNEQEYLNALKYMDRLIKNGSFRNVRPFLAASAYSEIYELAKKFAGPEKALFYFDSYAELTGKGAGETEIFYKSMLAAAYSLTIYTEYHSDEKQIQMMRDIYKLFNPSKVNSFECESSCFREINIGFLSSDFYFHPVGRFMYALFMENISNSGIKYFCYSTNTKHEDDDLTRGIKKNVFKYTEIGAMRPDEAEGLMLADSLDILFDLNGVSAGNKRELVINRLAPVQLTWIGFPCTSAIKNVDYNLVDYVTDPAGESEKFYTEKLAYLPKTFLCFPMLHDIKDNVFEIAESPFLKNGHITFASFNNCLKFTDRSLRDWQSVMRRVPSSRLVIRSANGTKDEIALNSLKRRFLRNGLDLSRVDFLQVGGYHEYLKFYNEADIILDTYPFNGATTTCDAFIMGVPVVSLYGKKHLERVGLSMLQNVGLGDLAAGTSEGFVENAVKLANNPERLMEIRRTLRETFRKSPLGDTASFKIDFENLMRKLYIINAMKNRKKKNPAEKGFAELVSEILRGFYFIEKLFFTDDDAAVLGHVKRELYFLQKAFIKKLSDSFDSDEPEQNKRFIKKYEDFTAMFFKNLSFPDLKELAVRGTDIYKKIF